MYGIRKDIAAMTTASPDRNLVVADECIPYYEAMLGLVRK